jgi:hypothetical protein
MQEIGIGPLPCATSENGIDETHAVQLARHVVDLYRRRRFTDLKVHLVLFASVPSVDVFALF